MLDNSKEKENENADRASNGIIFDEDSVKILKIYFELYKSKPSMELYNKIVDILEKNGVKNIVAKMDEVGEKYGYATLKELNEGIFNYNNSYSDFYDTVDITDEVLENFAEIPKNIDQKKTKSVMIESEKKPKNVRVKSQESFFKRNSGNIEDIDDSRKKISKRVQEEGDPKFANDVRTSLDDTIKSQPLTSIKNGVVGIVNGGAQIVKNATDNIKDSNEIAKVSRAGEKIRNVKNFFDELDKLCVRRYGTTVNKYIDMVFDHDVALQIEAFNTEYFTNTSIGNAIDFENFENVLIDKNNNDYEILLSDLVDLKYSRVMHGLNALGYNDIEVSDIIENSVVYEDGQIGLPKNSGLTQQDLEDFGIVEAYRKVVLMPGMDELSQDQVVMLASNMKIINGGIACDTNVKDLEVQELLQDFFGFDFTFDGINDINLKEHLREFQKSKAELEMISVITDCKLVRNEKRYIDRLSEKFVEADAKDAISYGNGVKRSLAQVKTRDNLVSLAETINKNQARYKKVGKNKSENENKRENDLLKSNEEVGGK